jgi:hypothetical protein
MAFVAGEEMAKCELCGKEVGFLRKRHIECQEKYESGSQKISEILCNTTLANTDLNSIDTDIKGIAQESFLDEPKIKSLLVEGWENLLTQALDDSVITWKEEDFLGEFRDHFALSQDELDSHGAYSKLVKSAVIREIIQGKLPNKITIVGILPFNFQKSESLIWVFKNVEYYELRTKRQYEGGSSGISVRVAKGLYYRVGGFQGHSIDRQENTHVGTGILAITNEHIYFSASGISAFKIAYEKIVSFTPYSDGIGIVRDVITAKPQTFVTGDGWFTYNLLSNLAKMRAQ